MTGSADVPAEFLRGPLRMVALLLDGSLLIIREDGDGLVIPVSGQELE